MTEEKDRRHPQRLTRITEVCRELNIDCIDIWRMFEIEGWRIGFIVDSG